MKTASSVADTKLSPQEKLSSSNRCLKANFLNPQLHTVSAKNNMQLLWSRTHLVLFLVEAIVLHPSEKLVLFPRVASSRVSY
jgi:hypothetical protein